MNLCSLFSTQILSQSRSTQFNPNLEAHTVGSNQSSSESHTVATDSSIQISLSIWPIILKLLEKSHQPIS